VARQAMYRSHLLGQVGGLLRSRCCERSLDVGQNLLAV
jgi:hypothetical protein